MPPGRRKGRGGAGRGRALPLPASGSGFGSTSPAGSQPLHLASHDSLLLLEGAPPSDPARRTPPPSPDPRGHSGPSPDLKAPNRHPVLEVGPLLPTLGSVVGVCGLSSCPFPGLPPHWGRCFPQDLAAAPPPPCPRAPPPAPASPGGLWVPLHLTQSLARADASWKPNPSFNSKD